MDRKEITKKQSKFPNKNLTHNKKPKLKTCKSCKKKFAPERDLQTTCNYKCAIAHNVTLREKIVKADKKLRKESLKAKLGKDYQETKESPLKIAQTAFNKYIRLRDGNYCITCKEVVNRQIHAGHYRAVGGNNALRFNTFNCHSQCSICNNYKSGNLAIYREELIKKIGLKKVEFLEQKDHNKKFGKEYYLRITKIFNKKSRILERRLDEN